MIFDIYFIFGKNHHSLLINLSTNEKITFYKTIKSQ